MGENTKIEWAKHTFNPVIGCEKVSPACKHCYAESWAKRTGHPELWRGERRRTTAANWRKPLKWNAAAEAVGKQESVFTASLGDWAEDHPVWDEARPDLWALIRDTPWLLWLMLTKRPQNVRGLLPDDWGAGYPNVAIGVTVENQERADERIPHLLTIPAALRFLSMEPLLGPVDLRRVNPWDDFHTDALDTPDPACKVHWVIAGGESGGKARPSHPDWFRSLRDQCAETSTAFHFKQWGEWAPMRAQSSGVCSASGRMGYHAEYRSYRSHDFGDTFVERRGKVASGRLLDGVEHNGFPVAP